MGHVRLGPLPKTRRWAEVVDLLRSGAGAAQMAAATLRAAAAGLARAPKDAGLVEAVGLLLRLPLAGKADDFPGELRALGLDVPDAPTLTDVVAAVSDALDRSRPDNRGRTDLGELAQAALTETLTAALAPHLPRLFGTQPEDVQAAFARHATVARFGALARAFFGRLLARYLTYHLGRADALEVGDGHRFSALADLAAFRERLAGHCHERALVVERFAGRWLSKTCWEAGGVEPEAVVRFVGGAVKKLAAELTEGGD